MMYTPNFCIRHALHRSNPIRLKYRFTALVIASLINLYCSWVSSVSFLAVISMMFVVVCKMAIQSFTGLVSIEEVHVLSKDSTSLFAVHESIVWYLVWLLSLVSLFTWALTPRTSTPVATCKNSDVSATSLSFVVSWGMKTFLWFDISPLQV